MCSSATRMLVLCAVLLGLAGSARAQAPANDFFTIELSDKENFSSTLNDATKRKEFFDRARCQCDSDFFVRVKNVKTFGTEFDQQQASLWIGQACDGTAADRTANCLDLGVGFPLSDFIDDSTTQDFKVKTTALAAKDPLKCGIALNSTKIWLLIDNDDNGMMDVTLSFATELDFKAPNQPTLTSVTGGDENIVVDIKNETDSDRKGYQALCSPSAGSATAAFTAPTTVCAMDPDMLGLTGFTPCSDLTSSGDITIKNISNGTSYSVVVVAVDNALNPSKASAAMMATGTPSTDFWERYRMGGADTGGCATAGGARRASWPWALGALAALLLLALARRRPRGAALLAALLVVTAGGVARAQDDAQPGGAQAAPDGAPAAPAEAPAPGAPLQKGAVVEPSQSVSDDSIHFYGEPPVPSGGGWARGRYLLELKFGPYRPNVDDEPGLTGTPYQDIFGSDDDILSTFEVGLALYRGKLGWAGVTTSIGYFSAEGHAVSGTGGTPTTDSVDFTIIPMTANALYRFDLLAAVGIPVVPYGKLGLVYDYWSSSNANGTSVDPSGNEASGGKFGWQGVLGVQLLLDALDRDAARNMASESGIDHLYIFAELLHADVHDFEDAALHLGDTTWLAGVAFEM